MPAELGSAGCWLKETLTDASLCVEYSAENSLRKKGWLWKAPSHLKVGFANPSIEVGLFLHRASTNFLWILQNPLYT